MTDPLLRAYQRAVYRLQLQDGPLDLHAGRPSADLRALLERHGAPCAAFLTAFNPGSRRTDDRSNQRAQVALARELAALGVVTLPGVGLDPDARWPEEPSVLALGLEAAPARALARRFGQKALLWIGADGTPELMLTGGADGAPC